MAVVETDYLVVGAGGSAMAFVDTLLTESPDATITMVDREARPGGHWNHAYPFVTLHQPSGWYGVPSRELSDWTRESSGLNEGMLSMASGTTVMAHFEQVMKERFLPSGRVHWLPKSEWLGGEGKTHRICSLLTGEETVVRVRRKLVNATHAKTEVPSTHPPRYGVAPGVECISVNRLVDVARPHARYTVVGSGKTGMDACIWLLQNGVEPGRIRWIMPRDPWMWDRANMQPGPQGWRRYFETMGIQLDAIANASDLPDLFRRLEEGGALMRLDPKVEPTTFRCPIVSRGELAQLRRIEDVVRLGRVKAIEPTRIVLDKGEVPAEADTLYIDCSASAIQPVDRLRVFDGDTIHLLMVRVCQPLFSTSLIAWVESHIADPEEQNACCRPVPPPELPTDFLRMWGVTIGNTVRWRQHPGLMDWLARCRLNAQVMVLKGVEITPEVQEVLKAAAMKAAGAAPKIPQLLAMA